MSVIKRVNTAELIRGQLLSLRIPMHLEKGTTPSEPLRFERGKPLVIADATILSWLESQMEEIEDGEGEVFEKPTFRIKRNVPAPDSDDRPSRTRLDADRTVKTRPIKRRRA